MIKMNMKECVSEYQILYPPLRGIENNLGLIKIQSPPPVVDMALPNFMYYHWAASKRLLLHWMKKYH